MDIIRFVAKVHISRLKRHPPFPFPFLSFLLPPPSPPSPPRPPGAPLKTPVPQPTFSVPNTDTSATAKEESETGSRCCWGERGEGGCRGKGCGGRVCREEGCEKEDEKKNS